MTAFARPARTASLFVLLLLGALLLGCQMYPSSGHAGAGYGARGHRGLQAEDSRAPQRMFFDTQQTNPFVAAEDAPLSTFAVDVDTGSYSLCRRYLEEGHLPPTHAPRVEEFVNAFEYGYPKALRGTFAIDMAIAPSRYGKDIRRSYLLRIGLRARDAERSESRPRTLTFVIDRSGSMFQGGRLELVKQSLALLIRQLGPDDRVGIVAYNGAAEEIADHSSARETTLHKLKSLEPFGVTDLGEGLRLGYAMADRAFRKGTTNRVVLCSDGVANTGTTSVRGILDVVREARERGIVLTTLGFGFGNFNDHLLEQLGDHGDGHYAYIDDLAEARHVLVEKLPALEVVAYDAKIQVEFAPETVQSYRLLGYENRGLRAEQFRDDGIDGGEVGAGHRVTALYEVKLREEARGPIATATVRYRPQREGEAREDAGRIGTDAIHGSWESAPSSLRLAAAAAELAEILRESHWAKDADAELLLRDIRSIANSTADDRVLELGTLVRRAKELRKSRTELHSSRR